MRDLGFDYAETPEEEIVAEVSSLEPPAGAGLDGAGYGFGRQLLKDMEAPFRSFHEEGGAPLDSRETNRLAALDDAFRQALLGGSQSRGCTALAWETATADLVTERLSRLDQDLRDAEASMLSDPGYISLEHAWAKCMALEGYDYDRLSDPRDDMRDRANEISLELGHQISTSIDRLVAVDRPATGVNRDLVSAESLQRLDDFRRQEELVARHDAQCRDGIAAQLTEVSQSHFGTLVSAHEEEMLRILDESER